MGFCSFSKISPGTASNDLNSCLMISGCFINENNTAYLTLTSFKQYFIPPAFSLTAILLPSSLARIPPGTVSTFQQVYFYNRPVSVPKKQQSTGWSVLRLAVNFFEFLESFMKRKLICFFLSSRRLPYLPSTLI